MPDFAQLESKLTEGLNLSRRPVAISFTSEPPAGAPPFEGQLPSGCSFWRLASEGRTFSTAPSDHYNCPIGSHTHNIPLPEARQGELMQTLGLMTDIGYLRMEEVPGIPRLSFNPQCIVYAPLADAPVAPDVVIVSGKPSGIMLLVEAATRAGAAPQLPVLARPTCMSIPAALAGGVITSTGCIGNRVYTDLGEDELYAAVRGSDLERVAGELETIRSANAKLKEYHQLRRAEIATA